MPTVPDCPGQTRPTASRAEAIKCEFCPKLADNVACGRTKTTLIVKEALSPHYLKSVVDSMMFPFSLMMDESNVKTDKSCIILVRTVDGQCGEVRTRFLDMPVVNIGTAENSFHALKGSLAKHGLDISNAMAFMSNMDGLPYSDV